MELADIKVAAILADGPEEHIRHRLQYPLTVDDAHTLAQCLDGRGQRVGLAPAAVFLQHGPICLLDLQDQWRAVGADQDD